MIAARNGPARQGAGNYRALERNVESGDPDEQGRRARLMADAQRGDRDAYGALLNDLGPIVMRFVRRHVRDGNDTEDVYQDVFTALHRARHTYDPSRPFEPWLFAITRRVVNDHERRRLTRATHETMVGVLPERSVEADGHVKIQLEQALHRLSAAQREAIRLVKLLGLPAERAAVAAGTTAGAVKVRAHRAYKLLRELL
jgi:RNA polymerase sigma factor (sigma-70 family)